MSTGTSSPPKMIESTKPNVRLAYQYTPGTSPGIMFLTGFSSNMDGNKALALEDLARKSGREMVRFDYRAHGQSEGEFADCCLSDWFADALTILDNVTSGGPIILVGSSMGGWIGLHVCLARPERVAAFIGIATAADFLDRIYSYFTEGEREILAEDEILSWPNPGAMYKFKKQIFEDAKKHNVLDRVEPLPITCPVRLLHGTEDTAVRWEISAQVLAKLASKDATLTIIKGGDHRLADEPELDRLKRVMDDLFKLVNS